MWRWLNEVSIAQPFSFKTYNVIFDCESTLQPFEKASIAQLPPYLKVHV